MSLTNNTNSWTRGKIGGKIDYSSEIEFLFKLDNTIQTAKSIQVQDGSVGHYIACTDMKRIILNFEQMRNLSGNSYFDFLIYVKGFNYHEMSHVMFTRYGAYSAPREARESLNVLEDQRIECVFSKKYPKSKSYFRLLSLGYVLKDGMEPNHYILLYGRRFIIGKQDIMEDLRDLCVEKYGENIIKQAEAIIDEYIETTDVDKQIALGIKFYHLFGQKVQSPYQRPFLQTKGKSSTSNEEKELTEQISEDIKKGLEKIEEEQKEIEQKNNQKTTESDERIGEQSNEGKEKDGMSSAVSQKTSKDNDDLQSGSGSQSNEQSELQSAINKLLKKTMQEVQDEVERQMSSMGKQTFEGSQSTSVNDSILVFTPESRHFSTMRKLKEQIKKMRNDLDNRTVYHQKRGKIDMRRAMINSNSYKIADFKKFSPSKLSNTRLAVTVLLDSSGSMSNSDFDTAVGSGWAIANALEECGSKVKVIEFSDNYRILKDFDEDSKKSKWGRNYNSGTFVISALKDAAKSLDEVSKRDNIKNQMIMIITDGGFMSRDTTEKITKELKDKGVYVTLFRVGSSTDYASRDAYNKIVTVRNFTQLTKGMTEMVQHIQLETVRKVKMNT